MSALPSYSFAGIDREMAALKSFGSAQQEASKARRDAEAIAEAEMYRVPALPRGCIEWHWNTDCVVPIICHLDYTPADGDNWNTPYYPENMTLCAAYLRGVDILEMLSADQIDRIEQNALEDHAEDARDAAAEARWEHQQTRIDEGDYL